MSWERLSKHKARGGLGFRDFRDFNLALLGKQGWRLITHPDKLSTKVYKARYFPDCHFLDSKLGNNPGFVWRSIWEAKQVVRAGARWRVGDGTSIQVLGHPWLENDSNPCITTDLQGLERATVASLMTMNGNQWDKEVVEDLFNQRDQNCIQYTTIGNDYGVDTLYWKEELNGEYSVRSAYRILQSQKGAWQIADNNSLWNRVWRIKAPPKVLNMVWRSLAQCLPTKSVLYAKRVPLSVTCPICNGEEETIYHALVGCQFASQCWKRRGWWAYGVVENNFDRWLCHLLNRTNKQDHGEIVTLSWNIWHARNNMVWNQRKSEVNNVVQSTQQYFAEWKKAQAFSTKALYQDVILGDGADSWVKPKRDEVKVTVDAAIFSAQSKHGIGMLARNEMGEVIKGRSEVFNGVVRPELAEAIGVREALSWVKKNKWRKVVIETDCLSLVQAIRSHVKMTSPFGNIVMDCRRMMVELNIEVFFIKRSANMAAHCLARESCSFPGRVFDRRFVPIEVKAACMADLFD